MCEHVWGQSSLKTNRETVYSYRVDRDIPVIYGCQPPYKYDPKYLVDLLLEDKTWQCYGAFWSMCLYLFKDTQCSLQHYTLKPQMTQQNSSLPLLPFWRPKWISNIKCFHKNYFFTLQKTSKRLFILSLYNLMENVFMWNEKLSW